MSFVSFFFMPGLYSMTIITAATFILKWLLNLRIFYSSSYDPTICDPAIGDPIWFKIIMILTTLLIMDSHQLIVIHGILNQKKKLACQRLQILLMEHFWCFAQNIMKVELWELCWMAVLLKWVRELCIVNIRKLVIYF